jgi:hypothetical protein
VRSGAGVERVRLELQNRGKITLRPWSFFEHTESRNGWLNLCMAKNIQTLHVAKFGHDEELYPLAQLQIPTATHVINL